MDALMRGGLVTICTAAALFLASAPAAGADLDAVRRHFEAGKKLRDEGDCTRAIPEFEQSLAADKSIGAYYNLGYCHEQLGHRHDAYEAYSNARHLASKKKDDRLREISGALAALLETPHVRLVLPQPLPEGIQIRVDDELVPASSYAAETVVFTKGGASHTVLVTAPGYEERREVVETKQVKPIELHRAAPKPAVSEQALKDESRGWTWMHWTGVGLAGAGVIASGLAVYFLLDYLPERSRLDGALTAHPCGSDGSCQRTEELDKPETPQNEHEDAKRSAAALRTENNDLESDIKLKGYSLAAVGGALMVSGVVAYLFAPRGETARPAPAATTPTSKLHINVVPRFGQREQGLSIVGAF
jgi:hypothetical protein